MQSSYMNIIGAVGLLIACVAVNSAEVPDYIYYNQQHIKSIQQEIEVGNKHYLAALQTIEKSVKKDLNTPIESVLDKPKAGPSGNKQDYLSLAPYFWPNPDTPNGLPWINKDGQLNPMTRGKHTDQERAARFLQSLKTLTIAYTYTGKTQYLERIKAYLDVWMVNPKTRMNSHLNYAQGWPGTNEGTAFGIIEWENVSSVVTAMQLLNATGAVDETFNAAVNGWLEQYLHWLLTSELGKHEATRLNNHGSWYDYQVVGLMIYLNKFEAAKQQLNITKARINQQFLADGSQPQELKRTKSVNYASMNLQALIHVAHMANKVGVDLWSFQGEKGQTLAKAISFFFPYLRGEKTWQYQQIWKTVEQAYKEKTYPMLHIARAHFGVEAVPNDIYNKVRPTVLGEDLLLYQAF